MVSPKHGWWVQDSSRRVSSISDYAVYIFRPNDSRMVVALGESYEKLERLQEAKKCFRKAHSIGDLEGTAIIKLAKYVMCV